MLPLTVTKPHMVSRKNLGDLVARRLQRCGFMTLLACLVENENEADIRVTQWLRAGIALNQLGLLLSETTQGRAEGTSRVGILAKDAVRVPSMGVMAAGSIVEDLAGTRGGLVDALAGLGLHRDSAETLVNGIQRGDIAVVAFTDKNFVLAPTVASPDAPSEETTVEEEEELEHVEFLNLDGLPDAGDPTARRFCLLEVD